MTGIHQDRETTVDAPWPRPVEGIAIDHEEKSPPSERDIRTGVERTSLHPTRHFTDRVSLYQVDRLLHID